MSEPSYVLTWLFVLFAVFFVVALISRGPRP